MCRRNDFVSTTTHFVLSRVYLRQQICFIGLADLGFWNTHVIHGCVTRQKSRLLRRSLARPGPWRIFALSHHHAQIGRYFWLERGQQRFAPYCSQMFWDGFTLQCLRTKFCSSTGIRLTVRMLLFTRPHTPSPFVCRACHGSHHEHVDSREHLH